MTFWCRVSVTCLPVTKFVRRTNFGFLWLGLNPEKGHALCVSVAFSFSFILPPLTIDPLWSGEVVCLGVWFGAWFCVELPSLAACTFKVTSFPTGTPFKISSTLSNAISLTWAPFTSRITSPTRSSPLSSATLPLTMSVTTGKGLDGFFFTTNPRPPILRFTIFTTSCFSVKSDIMPTTFQSYRSVA